MSDVLSRAQVQETLEEIRTRDTDPVRYSELFSLLVGHDATLRQQLAAMTAERDEWQVKARWKHTHDDSLEIELQKQLAAVTQERDVLIEQEKLQADSVTQLQLQLATARDVLQALYDVQNGCPLPKYEADWTAAMERAERLLAPTERPPA